jgi:hypothetical protein
MGRRSVDQLRARSQFGWKHSYDMDHGFKCVLHSSYKRMPRLHSTSRKLTLRYPSEAFRNIGKHCRIEVRCVALQPEDAGAEVGDWVPKVWELGRNGAPDKLKPTSRLHLICGTVLRFCLDHQATCFLLVHSLHLRAS